MGVNLTDVSAAARGSGRGPSRRVGAGCRGAGGAGVCRPAVDRLPPAPPRPRAAPAVRRPARYDSPRARISPYAPDSTLFFSPARARSMMTFSALRLIMPSIGILTSTVSR